MNSYERLTLNKNAALVCCVVYDTKTGDILHTHQIMTLPGATLPTQDEMEAEAYKHAGTNTGKPESEMAILHVQSEDLQKLKRGHKVHLIDKRLVESEEGIQKEKQ